MREVLFLHINHYKILTKKDTTFWCHDAKEPAQRHLQKHFKWRIQKPYKAA